jgi:tripartite-type tricarboxylate transporter receptor subunit TctC
MIRNLLILAFTSLTFTDGGPQTTRWPAPNRPITFINPFPPGGAVDAFGRPVGQAAIRSAK